MEWRAYNYNKTGEYILNYLRFLINNSQREWAHKIRGLPEPPTIFHI